jgi:hypothetical protein
VFKLDILCNAFLFTNRDGKARSGRYQFRPEAGEKFLSDVAAAQLNADRQPEPLPTNGPEPEPGDRPDSVSTTQPIGSGRPTTTTITPNTPQLRRFHGSVTLDARRLGRDASRIAEEVVQHLSSIVGADVRITLDIQANLAEGAGDKLVRDVTENCRTLKFTDFGFEEE